MQKLIKEDRDLFLNGLRAESLGLGIGAFTYYRRVVVNQKDRLFNKIIKVAEATGVHADRIRELKKARDMFEFSREISEFKALIPESIRIKGHNPMTLLHKSLSVGVHNMTDEDCLERAHDIRAILNELADRAAEALKETKELDAAVARVARLPRSQGE